MNHIPNAAWNFGGLALVCATFAYKGSSLSVGLNGMTIGKEEVAKQTTELIHEIRSGHSVLSGKMDNIEKQVVHFDTRLVAIEKEVTHLRAMNGRHIAAIDLMVGRSNLKISEDEIAKHFKDVSENGHFFISGFGESIEIVKKD